MFKRAIHEKVFRDNVHGYIRIPAIVVDKIIDTEVFQRLRHIEQTSMRPLYPAARHDRFIHSLGVFHLGNRAFKAIRETLPQNLRNSLPNPCNKEGWWDKRHYLFILACLLHDCAHAPFSHTLEKYYGLERAKSGSLSRLDNEIVKEYEDCQGFSHDFILDNSKGCGAEHEKMSCLLVGRYFREPIKEVFAYLGDEGYLTEEFSSVSNDDIALIARMIIGCSYLGDITAERSLDNCFIMLLNSSSIDVDGLDYTMRDTQSSGMDNWDIDYERLLASLRIRSATRVTGCEVSNIELAGIWLEGSEFVSENAESPNACLKVRGSFKGSFDDQSDRKRFLDCKGVQNQPEGTGISIDQDGELSVFANTRQNYSIETCSSCHISLSNWSGRVTGTILKPLDFFANACGSKDDLKQAYVLSYEKSSISIISGAIEARNSFYRWVYSHPHIQYHASFLQNYLLKMSAKYLCCRKYNPEFSEGDAKGDCPPSRCDRLTCRALAGGKPCPGEEDVIFLVLGLEGFYQPFDAPPEKTVLGDEFLFCRSTDDDLNALFRWVYLDNKRGTGKPKSSAIDKYFGEYFSRTRKHLLWKSPEDKKHFLELHPSCPDLTFSDLMGAENSLLSLDYVFVSEEDGKVAFFSKNNCSNLVAINVFQKIKGINFASTFISFDGDIERMIDVMDISPTRMSPKRFLYLFSDSPFGGGESSAE